VAVKPPLGELIQPVGHGGTATAAGTFDCACIQALCIDTCIFCVVQPLAEAMCETPRAWQMAVKQKSRGAISHMSVELPLVMMGALHTQAKGPATNKPRHRLTLMPNAQPECWAAHTEGHGRMQSPCLTCDLLMMEE
jgi:hypothetical protein